MCCAEADALVAIMLSLVYLVLPLQIEGIADHRLLVVLRCNCGSFAAEVVDTHVLSFLSGYRTKIVGFYASLCIVLVLLDMVDGVFLRKFMQVLLLTLQIEIQYNKLIHNCSVPCFYVKISHGIVDC